MAKLPINGVEYSVEVTGQGPPLVALHGFTGSTATWEPLAQAIGGEHTLVAVDLLGHGASSRPADPSHYSMEQCILELLGVLDALRIPAAVWLAMPLLVGLGLAGWLRKRNSA